MLDPKMNWVNLVKVLLPSGNQAIYSKPAGWMTAEDVLRYGLHIATNFKTWEVLDRASSSKFRQATTDEIKQFDDLPIMDQ